MNVAPLTDVTSGKRAIVIDVDADGRYERRLRELGFVSGSTIEVLNNKHGYIMVRLRGVKYGLSPEIARMIHVMENSHFQG